jgi:hypothetical protein
MKFLLSFLTFGLAAATLPIYGNPKRAVKKFDSLNDVKADSKLGLSLLSKARKLENNGEIDYTWISNFSIKFQGCHHISQWNDAADGEEDVRIETKRLIRFRLCPANECSPDKAGGCDSDYGDYVIDMNTFLESYYDALENYNEYRCEYTSQVLCDCEDGDDKGDDFNGELCEYDCYVTHGIEDICADNNPYADDEQEQEEEFNVADYVECQQAEFANNDEERTYSSLAGSSLPYSEQSLISMDCISCKEPEDFNNDGDDAEDDDEVIEMCEEIYEGSGKCEQGLEATGYLSSANNNACNYIAGIKVVRKDGIITQVGSKANKTASIFIGIFAVAFVLLASYVYYLKTKLDRASINLSD